MNMILVELTVEKVFPWNESVLGRLREQVQQRAFGELDSRFGGESWCSRVQPVTVDEGRIILFQLTAADGVDVPTVMTTFRKHWRDVQEEEKKTLGVTAKKPTTAGLGKKSGLGAVKAGP